MPTEARQSVDAGLELHKHDVFCGIINQEGQPIYRRHLPAELPTILQALEAYRTPLKAIAVESTFNWYWLVDGLQAADYPVRLANPAEMQKYSGLKQTDDETDALWLAEMLRLCERSSDGKPLGRKRLDRAGNSALKAMSYHIWLGALRGCGANEVKTFFEASLARTQDKTHARLNTQRKVLASLWGLWKRKERYDPEKFLGIA